MQVTELRDVSGNLLGRLHEAASKKPKNATAHRSRFLPGLATAACYALLFAITYFAAVQLRFDFQPPAWMLAAFWSTLVWVVGVKLLVFACTRQYRAWWGHVSFHELIALTLAAAFGLVVLSLPNQLGWLPSRIPRAVLLLDCAFTVLLVGAVRSGWRLVLEFGNPLDHWRLRRALLVAANGPDKILALQWQSHARMPFKICGHLDETSERVGRSIGGVPVLGVLADLEGIACRQRATDVVVIAGSLPGGALRRLRTDCAALSLKLHVLPPLGLIASEQTHLPTRAVAPEDLLQRPQVHLDDSSVLETIQGECIFVTGGGGSIGSEICRQLIRFNPRRLVVVDRSEPSLYHIELELRALNTGIVIEACLGDINDEPRMRRLLERYQPSVVFHVAAHKHVPLLEAQAGEAVKNNVFGTALLAELAAENNVERFVYVSTDKAVNPSSIMGVSKHLAERFICALDSESRTRFMAVRFGNVLGSAGSVVPRFEQQIRQGGPITVTHADMTRYFMTIPEAARLVLQATAVGEGGEIFVLDMGEPVRIVDLARDMVRLSGLPAKAIDIEVVGIRPGEKLYEELYFDDEIPIPTSHPKLLAAEHRAISIDEMRERLAELKELVDDVDDAPLLACLKRFVPEYSAGHSTRSPASQVPSLN